jgi:hypothetical protein
MALSPLRFLASRRVFIVRAFFRWQRRAIR